ncbi:MAG: hypothetical protein ACI9F9_001278 [Candidatus Paceibacteria bacterium]|jgi:hypothetical protein
MSQPIIKRSQVQLGPGAGGGGPVRLVHSAPSSQVHGQKSVQLLEEDGRVRAIELTCSCGDVTAVELTYPGDA